MSLLSSQLERWALPRWPLGSRGVSSFHVWTGIGLVAGAALSLVLATWRDLSWITMAAVIAVAVLAFVLIALVRKIWTGDEVFVFYRDAITATLCGGLFLRYTGEPVLAYLECLVLGIGLLQGLGRLGCFQVGCCHGKPWPWGVRYGGRHVAVGFPSYLCGVRLLPVQMIECVWALAAVGLGAFLVWRGSPAGVALTSYVVLYASGRFGFELLRGDPERPYLGRFSQAQWISLALVALIVLLEAFAFVPAVGWHRLFATALVLVSILLLAHPSLPWRLTQARHIREIAQALPSRVDARRVGVAQPTAGEATDVLETSLGLLLSRGDSGPGLRHYTLSARYRLTKRQAKALARLVLLLRGETLPGKLVPGREGCFHVIACGS